MEGRETGKRHGASIVDTNLVRRISTAIVLVPGVVAAVLWLPSGYFVVALSVFMVAGSWEWAGLSDGRAPGRRLAYAAATVVVTTSLFLSARSPHALLIPCAAGAAWWGVALLWIVGAQRGRYAMTPGVAWRHWLCGWMVLVPAFCALALLHASGPPGRWWIILLLTFVWSADVGAYFTGRRYGRRRLASRLSPGKSWEGVLGGVVACLAIGIGVALGIGDTYAPPWFIPVLGVGVALVSVLGDLTESLVKRQAGVKDSGVFIPGHGGVLDRIDSLCAAAPCFALVLVGMLGSKILR